MPLSLQSTVKLNNGIEMPILGLGVWQMSPGKATQTAVKWALECGYRLIDTAKLYANEKDVGFAVRESGLPRENVFVTTKLWNTDHGYDSATRAFRESLRQLDMEFVDLYLIHWPVPRKRGESWKALMKLYEDGKSRAIGVSNYTVSHLEELIETSGMIPAVNQVEFSPFLFQEDLLKFCQKNEIQLEAYSPLTKGLRLDYPELVEMADKYERTPAQILLRWALQHDVVVIPKSEKKEHIIENSRVFDFQMSSADMTALDKLNEDYHTTWNPADLQ